MLIKSNCLLVIQLYKIIEYSWSNPKKHVDGFHFKCIALKIKSILILPGNHIILSFVCLASHYHGQLLHLFSSFLKEPPVSLPPSLLTSYFSSPFSLSSSLESALYKTANNLHISKINGQFTVFIIFAERYQNYSCYVITKHSKPLAYNKHIALHRGSAHLFCKGLASKGVRFCGLYGYLLKLLSSAIKKESSHKGYINKYVCL